MENGFLGKMDKIIAFNVCRKMGINNNDVALYRF